jgi:hypothetical protein
MSSSSVLEAGSLLAAFEADHIAACLRQVREPVRIVGTPDGGPRGLVLDSQAPGTAGTAQLGTLPALYP